MVRIGSSSYCVKKVVVSTSTMSKNLQAMRKEFAIVVDKSANKASAGD